MNLSEMRQILADGGIQLTKSLGQNFLHDGNQLRRITEAAALIKADHVLEIGPGLGPLTELLLDQAGEVLAIEKDRRLVEFLQKRFHSATNLKLICEDALGHLKQRPAEDWRQWKLVANLPYSVASPILVELAINPHCPERLVATLQLEVAERINAAPDSEHYGLLTVLLQLRYESAGWFKIPASCFFPEPDVDSACVVLVRRSAPLAEATTAKAYFKIVKRSFSQRRKMMFKLLKADWPVPALTAAFAEAKIALTERAEKVTAWQFAQLAASLNQRESNRGNI